MYIENIAFYFLSSKKCKHITYAERELLNKQISLS